MDLTKKFRWASAAALDIMAAKAKKTIKSAPFSCQTVPFLL